MKIVIVNYGSGNLHSVHKSFEKTNQNLDSLWTIEVSKDPEVINKADKVVLPGVGAYADCKKSIDKIDGLFEALEDLVIHKKKCFMGICVGMQLLADSSSEFGTHKGFGWIPGAVVEIPRAPNFKIPHMGWNEIQFKDHKLFTSIEQNTNFYFVHSFYFKTVNKDHTLATTNYPEKITAAIIYENIFGTQFHPEKSHNSGQQIIKNFIEWKL
tara:strand:+ start:35 stop:670 length:636 start_codon:yes stop_codon:yes gene_type:complete